MKVSEVPSLTGSEIARSLLNRQAFAVRQVLDGGVIIGFDYFLFDFFNTEFGRFLYLPNLIFILFRLASVQMFEKLITRRKDL